MSPINQWKTSSGKDHSADYAERLTSFFPMVFPGEDSSRFSQRKLFVLFIKQEREDSIVKESGNGISATAWTFANNLFYSNVFSLTTNYPHLFCHSLAFELVSSPNALGFFQVPRSQWSREWWPARRPRIVDWETSVNYSAHPGHLFWVLVTLGDCDPADASVTFFFFFFSRKVSEKNEMGDSYCSWRKLATPLLIWLECFHGKREKEKKPAKTELGSRCQA